MTGNTISTPEEAAELPVGQWVFDADGTPLCLVDTHLGWPQRMFMTSFAKSFTAVDGVAYPLELADVTDDDQCPHSWGFNECGHCKRCGVVVGESEPLFFEPDALAVFRAAAEQNSRIDAKEPSA